MKKSTIVLTAILFIVMESQAQKWVVRTYLEKALDGSKVGSTLGHVTKWDIEAGGFYQEALSGRSESTVFPSSSDEFEERFFGLYAAIPLMYSQEVDFQVQIRAGLMNDKNIVTTPSLLGNYRPAKNIKFGFGIGFRALTPTIQSSFSFSF